MTITLQITEDKKRKVVKVNAFVDFTDSTSLEEQAGRLILQKALSLTKIKTVTHYHLPGANSFN
jgi:hypothetical protein